MSQHVGLCGCVYIGSKAGACPGKALRPHPYIHMSYLPFAAFYDVLIV